MKLLPAPYIQKIQVVDTSCWLWTGALGGNGYGRIDIRENGKRIGSKGAHRVIYELLAGPIPDGLTLDHLCRVRNCVNPAHLEPVTQKENALRGFGVGALNARKTECVNGHPFTPDNINWRCRHGTQERECRECNLIRGRIYKAKVRKKTTP